MYPKIIPRTPDVTMRAITLADDHGMIWPPHWSARMRQQVEPMKVMVPTRSICWNFFEARTTVFVVRASESEENQDQG